MPTRMLNTLAEYVSGRGRIRALIRQAAQAVPALRTIEIRGPFGGLAPDVDPNLLDGTFFRTMTNLVAYSRADEGEVLTTPAGYRQVAASQLPLGDSDGSLPADDGDEQPIVRLDQILRFAPTGHASAGDFAGEFILTGLAVTAGDGSTAGSGMMYRINSSSAWVEIAPATSMQATTLQLSADRDGRSVSNSMPDSCVAPFGATGRSANTSGGDDKQSGAIDEPCWVFTNDVDPVMVFPSHSDAVDGTRAGNHWYEPLCDATDSEDLAPFMCKSVETWNGRVYFLNTSEAGTRYSQRLRRTAKFTADPLTTSAGAGHFDFREFQGEGLRIEKLGNSLAAYFTDGVAFVQPTGNPTSPDTYQILSAKRGLLGTHCVTSIERNVHFGIFTDGWWKLDESGRWQEVGVAQVDGKLVHKWRQTFFDNLPPDMAHRIYVYYDQKENLVRIAVPTISAQEPEEVWLYDPVGDRLFMENYSVTCFGSLAPPSTAATTIDNFVGTIDAATGTIDSWGSVAGDPFGCVHGTVNGYVFSHDRADDGYETQSSGALVSFPWYIEMGLRSPSGIRNFTTIDRVSIEYFNRLIATPTRVSAFGSSQDSQQTDSVLLIRGELGDLQVEDVWLRFTSRNPGLSLGGSGRPDIRALAIDLWSDHEPRQDRSTTTES